MIFTWKQFKTNSLVSFANNLLIVSHLLQIFVSVCNFSIQEYKTLPGMCLQMIKKTESEISSVILKLLDLQICYV